MSEPAARAETSIEIAASPETVYTYLADFPRHVEWNEQPQVLKPLTEGPSRVGSRYATEEGMPSTLSLGQRVLFTFVMPVMKAIHGMSDDTIAEITALEPHSRIAWEAHLPSKRSGEMMRMHWALDLEPTPSGTRVTQRCEVRPPESSPFARLVNEDFADNIRQGIEGNLTLLKQVLESAPAFA